MKRNNTYPVAILLIVLLATLQHAAFAQSAPHITKTYPESWGILASLNEISFNFNETVFEQSGKSIVIYNAADDTPQMTFTLPSASVYGTGTDSIYIYLGSNLLPGDYYVNIDPGAYKNQAGVDFAGITDKETWKISIIDVGLIENDLTWHGDIAIYCDIQVNFCKLTINPGTHVKFMGHYNIDNWGTIHALGTVTDTIHFNADNASTGWEGFRMDGEGHFKYCRFENGNAHGSDPDQQGGVFYIHYTPHIIIENCTFFKNHASGGGGAIYARTVPSLTIKNCIFEQNTAEGGGAVSINTDSECSIFNNLFINNSATSDGGALEFYDNCSPTIYNNTFTLNQAPNGGAVACELSSHPVLKNCIFYQNQASLQGNEISVYFGTGSGNADIYYCLVEGGQAGIGGPFTGAYQYNIDQDPLFSGYGIHPYSLQVGSPCIDAGDPATTSTEVGDHDLAGGWRFMFDKIDMGAYEKAITFDGFPGTALHYDGSSHYVAVADKDALDLTDNFTVETWIKPEEFAWLAGIVGKYQSSGSHGFTLRLTGTTPYSGIEFNGQSTPTGVLETGNWYHIAAVRQSGQNHIYINGVEQALSGSSGTLSQNSDPLCIGVDYLTSPRYFNGLIDEVRIWNQARTVDEIRESMNLNLPGSCYGLVSYWQFNDGNGTIAIDLVSSNNGALHNMDDVDWVNSDEPMGGGTSNTQIISSTGSVDYTATDVSMDLTAKTGTDTIVVSRIDTIPNSNPSNCDLPFSSQYWVINNFGTGQFAADVSFTISETLTASDESNPHHIALFRRESNSDGEWVYWKVASSVDASTNTATFEDVESFSQLMLGRFIDTVPPTITSTYPESWGILESLGHLELNFDKSVTTVSGKTITIFNASNHTPERTITLPSADVTGTGTAKITVQLNPVLAPGNYYVKIDSAAFRDPSNNAFAGITDTETWKITILDNGLFEQGDATWSGNIALYTRVVIMQNYSLTISPGSQVKFMGHYYFDNYGTLIAQGTELDSISFFANEPATGWDGFQLSIDGTSKFKYCNIRDSRTLGSYQGGAMYIYANDVLIENCTFMNNFTEGDGAAINVDGCNALIRNNVFRNNHSLKRGGAISLFNFSTPKIVNNLFTNNNAGENGGGVVVLQNSSPQFYNNTFSQNSAAHGGAFSCIHGASADIYNCILYDNTATHGGNEVSLVYSTYPPGEPNFYYCDIEGGKEAFEGTYTGTYENNIDDVADFIGHGEYPFALLKASPCVNTGDPTTTTAEVGDTDLAGGPRFLHGQIDMGAYETSMTPDGFAGTALDFDGVNDYVDCGNDASLDITDAITVEAWIKPDVVSHNNNILEKGNNYWLSWDYSLESISGKGIQINLPGPNTGWWEFQYDMDYNKWYHVAWTYSSDGILTGYVNGEIVRWEKFTGPLQTNTDHLKMAAVESGHAYRGLLDEIRIWKVARTESEIRENMYLTFPENEPNMVSYYQCNSGEGNLLADLVGVNRGKLTNMTDDDWVPSTIPFGAGQSNTQIVSGTGNKIFTNTGIEMDFFEKSGTDTITATRIDTLPNILPSGAETIPDSSYWEINPFGEGTYNAMLKVTPNYNLTFYDEINPTNLLLFNRENTSDQAWTFSKRASSVDAQTNTIFFDSVSGSGQFMVTKNEFDNYPGYALQFDTASGYLELADEHFYDFDTAFTIETWIYIEPMTVDYHTILSKGDEWELRAVYSNDAVMLEFTINKGDYEQSVTILSDTATMLRKWNHITCIYRWESYNSEISLYLNGGNKSTLNAVYQIRNSNVPVLIGQSFKGKLDELRFWRQVRSTQQIRESMHLTLDYPFNGLVSNFQLNEGKGTTVKEPFMGNHGTLTNFTPPAGWVVSDIPFGGGASNTQTGQSGSVDFPGTGFSMDFDFASGASITVSKIDTTPNKNPTALGDVFDAQYWVVERYGDGQFIADLTFAVDEYLSENDEQNPQHLKLFHRPENSTDEWSEIASAASADPSSQQITFEDINVTGQFILGRKKPFSGYPGYALHFDGENDYITGSGMDTNLSAFTIEAWVKHDTLPAMVQRYFTIEPEVAVLRYDGTVYGGYRELHFYIKKANGYGYAIRVDSVLETGKWMHVAGTYDGETMRLYLNGRLLETKTPAAALFPPDGNFEFSSPSEAMDGQMDEIRIWNKALTTAQIRESMHRVFEHSQEGLIYYWQFNEGSGNIAADTMSGLQGDMHNFNISTCWTESSIPAGMGVSNTQWVSATGPVDFSPTSILMDFTANTGNDSIVVTKINLAPNLKPPTEYQSFDDQYWVVNRFGTGSLTTDIVFTVSEDLQTADEVFPSTLKLFSRNSNSDSSWILVDSAQAVNVADHTAKFEGINHFSQFLIARGENHILPPGNCLQFDGVDDYVSIPPDTSLNNNAFTVEFWISTSNPENWRGIIDKGRNTNSDWYFLTGASGNTEGVVFGVGNGSSINELSHSWNDEYWHHVSGTYDGDTMRLFVDGTSIGYKTVTLDNTANGIRFGDRLSGASHFYGLLDEIRIWNVKRNQEQIRENMHKPLVGNEPNLVSYWRFDESSEPIAHDFAGMNNGTLHNMKNQWKGSTAPVPYFTVTDGNWESVNSWATGQNAPGHPWARARIEHQVSLNSNSQLMELIIESSGVLSVLTGFTLIISK